MKHIFTVFIFILFFMASILNAQVNWTKDTINNPVLVPGPAGTWSAQSIFPVSILFKDATYHLWYGGFDGTTARIGYATSADGIAWTPFENNPVFDVGVSGAWDDFRVQSPYVLYDGATYHMWYTGVDGQHGRIGYATAPQPEGPWTRFAGNPVLNIGASGTWCDESVASPCVYFDGSAYHMWYQGEDGQHARIGYATAPQPEGPWTAHANNPVFNTGAAGSWDDNAVLYPELYFDGTIFHMWYSGNAAGWEDQIGYATSEDGITWTRYIDNPVLEPGSPGQWDNLYVLCCRVLWDVTHSQFEMWYGGGTIAWQGSLGYAAAPKTILNVPGDYSSIQATIDAAADGDVVLVADSTYYENINFKGKAITVASHFYLDGDTSHIANTIINGSTPSHPDSGSVVYMISGEDTSSVLCGFTITNGTGTISEYTWGGVLYPCRVGGGIFCGNSGGRFVTNIIKNNRVSDQNVVMGGGIAAGEFGSDAWIILENNQIINNTVNSEMMSASGGGIGIICNGKIINNIIANDSCIAIADNASGGGIQLMTVPQYPRTVYISDNQITHNFIKGKGTSVNDYWAAAGAGIQVSDTKTLILNNEISHNRVNSFAGNGYGGGGGIYLYRAANGSEISANKISHNVSGCTNIDYGGGLGVSTCPGVSIRNNIISDNAANQGGGIRLKDCHPEIINNTIVNNTASPLGGGLQAQNANPKFINNIVWGNQAASGAGIYPPSLTSVRYSDVQGGYSGLGNMNCEPCFCDSLCNLADSSACIGTGIDSLEISGSWYYAPPYDYKGAVRPNPVDPYVDIGAQESAYLILGIIEEGFDLLPKTYALKQNYPNPFNPATTIEFSTPKTERVTLKIYNILGEALETLVSEKLAAGTYQYEWDAGRYASGVYLYRLETSDFARTRKLVLLK